MISHPKAKTEKQVATNEKTKAEKLADAMLRELNQLTPVTDAVPSKPFARQLTLILCPVRAFLARHFDNSVKKRAEKYMRKLPESPEPKAPAPDLFPHEQKYYNAFDDCRKAHRKLSTHYSIQYKGSYLLNYQLAVTAVTIAVLCLGLLYVRRGIPEKQEHTRLQIEMILLALGSLKLVCLTVIYINTKQAEREEFNQRAIAYRFLMEQMRCMYFLPLFGIRRVPSPSSTAFISRKFNNTVLERHFRNMVSETMAQAQTGPAEVHYGQRLPFLLHYVSHSWIGVQRTYHQFNELKYKRLDECYEKRVFGFNIFVMVIVGLDILWSVAHFQKWLPERISTWLPETGTPLVLMLAAIVPAVVSSFNALRVQTEARGLAERSRAMGGMLGEQQEKYERLITEITQSTHKGAFTERAMTLVTETAQIMIDEVTEWTFIYANLVFES